MRKTTKMILKKLKEVQKRREMREEMNSRAASEKEKGGTSQGQNPAAQARARTMLLMQEMPGVCTAGLPRTVEGFLYKYKTGHVVIVCLCHGSFLTLEDFVKHAGAVNVENAMQQIVMKPAAP